MAEINEAEVIDALHEYYDPEIPVNIVDLGLVYNVGIDNETGTVDILDDPDLYGVSHGGRRHCRSRNARREGDDVKACKVEMTFSSTLEYRTNDRRCQMGTGHGLDRLTSRYNIVDEEI